MYVWDKNKKIRYNPCQPQFFFSIKVGFKGVYISRICYPDVALSTLVSRYISFSLSSAVHRGRLVEVDRLHCWYVQNVAVVCERSRGENIYF